MCKGDRSHARETDLAELIGVYYEYNQWVGLPYIHPKIMPIHTQDPPSPVLTP